MKRNPDQGRKWHIKPRIFAMLLALLFVVFASVFFAFNAFISGYIRSNVRAQLDDLVVNFGKFEEKPPDRGGQGGGYAFENGYELELPDLNDRQKNRIGANGKVFVVDASYDIKGYGVSEDTDELSRIASLLKEKGVSLSGARYVPVGTDQGEYYVSTAPAEKQPGSFFVFYVDVSGINSLVDTVNLSLAVIVAAGMLICFFIANVIANSVTTPVKKLSKFAVEIGKGNFAKRDFRFQDVEFDELGEAMNQSAEKLDLYDKDQRAFFQNVSHELRTPLMSIRCYAEGVECGLMDPKRSGATIISETDRLSALVEDLLYISRVDSITDQIEKRENDLRETLSLCAESLKSVIDKNGLKIVYEFDEAPVLFPYNEKHMFRAFVNLIANAIRYAQGTIVLACRRADGRIEASVADDGPGILQEDLVHIFERFYKGRDGKHGIGLSIVKSVVELHGGEIKVDCGEGTRFTIVFPGTSAERKTV
ncbi:MAG: HAMP domain-containing sensor histidine kinase [Bacillota bacterium]